MTCQLNTLGSGVATAYTWRVARLTPAVVRTLDILELFVAGEPELTAPEIVARTGFPRTSVHELLKTLVAREYLQRDDRTGTYRLGVHALHLGNAYSAQFDLLSAANLVVRSVAERSGETVSVAVRDGTDVLFLAKVEGRHVMRLPSAIGRRLHAHVTGLGKALLAALSEQEVRELYAGVRELPALTPHSIRRLDALDVELAEVRARDGIAFEVEESTPNIRCVAAPVRDVTGQVVAAFSVSLPIARWPQQPVEYWVDLARGGADELSRQLGYRAAA